MAAISLNASLRGLIERALLIAPTFADDLEVQILKDDMASECISVKSLRILRKALLEMKDESSLHSYIVGSKVTFPTLKPKTTQVSIFWLIAESCDHCCRQLHLEIIELRCQPCVHSVPDNLYCYLYRSLFDEVNAHAEYAISIPHCDLHAQAHSIRPLSKSHMRQSQ